MAQTVRSSSLHKEVLLCQPKTTRPWSVASYEEVWNNHHLGIVDELVAPEVLEHNPVVPGQGPGREGFKQSLAMALTAFPDGHLTIEDMVAEDDKVVVRSTARATHRGEFMGIPPMNKQMTIAGIDIWRYEGGKRVESWRQWDILGLLQQLGVVLSPGQSS